MEGNKVFMGLVIVAVVIAAIATGITYLSVSNLISQISGYVTTVTTTGIANLTVETLAQINFTTAVVTWGSGRVGLGSTAASLTTSNYDGLLNVTGGNWTLDNDPKTAGLQDGGFVIENIGNVNVTINFTAGKNAATFIGGTNPAYEWNLTAIEAGSCLNGTAQNISFTMNRLLTVTSAEASAIWCDVFPYEAGKDTIRIDINLTIPESSITGQLTDTITATVTA
ncbi:MAG: hypothetical protein Q8P57_04075, partial [Candidatus Pacearchaeota archaeon]|nr:hypothetical protein [Candidatus Pacearchaeota archaeon]